MIPWGAIFGSRSFTEAQRHCCDGLPPTYSTCDGPETTAPEPYLLKVFGDRRPVVMCRVHRENSQRDADETVMTK